MRAYQNSPDTLREVVLRIAKATQTRQNSRGNLYMLLRHTGYFHPWKKDDTFELNYGVSEKSEVH